MERNNKKSKTPYDRLENCKEVKKINSVFRIKDLNGSKTICHNLEKICKYYGEIRYTYHRHCPEVAKFLQENESEVLSIITYNE